MLLLAACSGDPPRPPAPIVPTDSDTSSAVEPYDVEVTVLLDGAPAPGAIVMQGGAQATWTADEDGRATVRVDPSIVGDQVVLAAHAEARVAGLTVVGPAAITLELVRFVATDNMLYTYADPGPLVGPGATTAQCDHCHVTLQEAWVGSAHRTSASNPTVQDVYAGTASWDEAECAAASGVWAAGVEPGTGAPLDRCVVDLDVSGATGGAGSCADCHAPGIDGALGGRDLLEATGIAYDAGVHCDVCHHISDVDLLAPPGVGGRLAIVRPSEAATSPGMGLWQPLTFGPLIDVLNPRMGSVYRPLFHEALLCAGCHEQEQASLVGVEVDRARWPSGLLPIHSTYSEWEAGPMNPSAPCQSCHMPPVPDVGNSADLYNEFADVMVGIAAGWERPPGAVRSHAFVGPRQPAYGMLELAASLGVVVRVGASIVAEVTVANVGPGHAIPTGEPLRSLILLVDARCDGTALVAEGGDVVPDFGGAEETRLGGAGSGWPEAQVGDVLRVVRRAADWRDYTGAGPFGDGTFDARQKGMPVEAYVGESRVTAVDDGVVTLDAPLPAIDPETDVVYRVAEQGYAGAPGYGYAKVLVGADGARMVPHFLAVDVASDNRILPTESWTSTHTFPAACASPEVEATLLHRDYPLALARQRGWVVTDSVMAQVTR